MPAPIIRKIPLSENNLVKSYNGKTFEVPSSLFNPTTNQNIFFSSNTYMNNNLKNLFDEKLNTYINVIHYNKYGIIVLDLGKKRNLNSIELTMYYAQMGNLPGLEANVFLYSENPFILLIKLHILQFDAINL